MRFRLSPRHMDHPALLLVDRVSCRLGAWRLAVQSADEMRDMAASNDKRAEHAKSPEERAYLSGEVDAYRFAALRLDEVANAAQPGWGKQKPSVNTPHRPVYLFAFRLKGARAAMTAVANTPAVLCKKAKRYDEEAAKTVATDPDRVAYLRGHAAGLRDAADEVDLIFLDCVALWPQWRRQAGDNNPAPPSP
ncbi:hypothetical protein [Actinomadura hibisca]|uniref:hypothetical protein n=1 Tax=Actinomadura hibisca TaxID=68565 RepID=UPI000B33B712|nr:hypothetical protein [Actinomadura hibisca]